MNTVSSAVLRACLKAFLGEPEYRKFLEAGATEPLKFWQERAWEKFIAKYPELTVTSEERASALDVCPAHESTLMVGFTDSPEGYTFIKTPEMRRDFPNAPLMPLLAVGINRVKYCPQCLSAQNEYFAVQSKQQGAAGA